MEQKSKKATYTSPIAKVNGDAVTCTVWILQETAQYYKITHIESRKEGVWCLKEYITIEN